MHGAAEAGGSMTVRGLFTTTDCRQTPEHVYAHQAEFYVSLETIYCMLYASPRGDRLASY